MKKINLSDINKSLINYDLFICSSSFENRCLKIAGTVNSQQFKNAIICHFENNYIEDEDNLSKLKALFDSPVILELSKNSPLGNYDKLFYELNHAKYANVLLDISTFTRKIFLLIIQLFRQPIFSEKKLTLCYNPSEKYNESWLTKGVQDIHSILGFSRDFSPIK